ncbi:MAG: T9SS C-terminal target domain-containing protein [Ignavibacteriales bacterium]|nr:MAG: T9SS C-terminal target domain-containing protein [Ignavibacteriales bacterium]
MECFFKAGGLGSLNAGGIGIASFTYSYNNWNLVELIVDIDNDAAGLKFNGTSIYTWPWSAGATGNGSLLQLSAIDFFGETDQYQMYVDDFTFTDLLFVSVEDSNEVNVNAPVTYSLDQNYPNPFNPSTKIKYSLPVSGCVSLKVYDILGKEVTMLVNEEKTIGTYELNWNPTNLPSGVYFYRLQAGSFVQTRKMILLK